MKVYNFRDYKEYKDKNVEVNLAKLRIPGFSATKYIPVVQYVRKHIGQPTFGLCHGTRNGTENAFFQQHLQCPVIGTDISHSANEFPGMIEWDFHHVKPEWLDNVDFIYSNATDHSHSLEYCIYQWIRCLKPNGLIFIEWDEDKLIAGNDAADCFGATFEEYREMFDRMGCFKDVIHAFGKKYIYVLKKVDVDVEAIQSLNRFKDEE